MDGVIRFVNEAVESLFGYERVELIGQPITRLIPPRLHDAATEGIRRYRNRIVADLGGGTLESVGEHKDGQEISMNEPRGSSITLLLPAA